MISSILIALMPLFGTTMGGPRVPVSGTYNARGLYDTSFSQLRLDTENGKADFEFILNNDVKAGLEYPRLFQITNMDYELYQNGTLKFLTKPEDNDREMVKEMKKYFTPLGVFNIPIEAAWTEDGTIVASIMLLDAELSPVTSGDIWDMDDMLKQLKGELTTTSSPVAAANSRLEDDVPPNPLVAAASSDVVIATAASPPPDGPGKSSTMTSLTFFIFLVTIIFPLAEGMTGWLLYC